MAYQSRKATNFGNCPCDCAEKGRIYCFFDRVRYLDKGMWKEPGISMGGYTFRIQREIVTRK